MTDRAEKSVVELCVVDIDPQLIGPVTDSSEPNRVDPRTVIAEPPAREPRTVRDWPI